MQLFYGRLPPGERQRQAGALLAACRAGDFSLENLLVAREGENIVGVLLMAHRPGRTAFLWPPVCHGTSQNDPASIAAGLLQCAAERLDSQEIQFTQALIEHADDASRQLLNREGFPEGARLSIWNRAIGLPGTGGRQKLCSIGYAPEFGERFARTFERTLIGSLDCPIIGSQRNGIEALAAHQATGRFHPRLWRLYQHEGMDIAVLLVADFPETSSCELAYLGVVPEVRGRGWGRTLVGDAIEIGKGLGREYIDVAVDNANYPAVAMYEQMGFQRQRELAVHLRLRKT